jgi:beta-glucosidase
MEGRTYRYASEEAQFPFGFGLGYSRFSYGSIEAPLSVAAGAPLAVRVTLTNAGSMDAEEVVQLYLSFDEPSAGDPLYTLVGFRRVALAAGATQAVEFELTAQELATVDVAGRSAVRPGAYRLLAGGSSPGERSRVLGAPPMVDRKLEIGAA